MQRTAFARLQDMQDAISNILDMLAATSFEQFKNTWQTQRAAERGLEIISEASRALSDDLKAIGPKYHDRKLPPSAISFAMNISVSNRPLFGVLPKSIYRPCRK